MSKIDYQSLREAVQNYQSTLAWYQEKPDSPNAERDCDAALAAFKREIHHREVDIIAGLLDELDEKQQYIKLRDQENEDIALTVGKLRVELEETKSKLNEQREYYEGVISDGGKRIAELEAREVQLPTRYDLRYGHPINADERHVMIPKENGSWLYLIDLEHALRVAGIRIKGEEHGNKTRG
ncbi:ead/Ea22-like family protein [Escherichia coli]|uniref:ead/Ea22-like family protein n=1 Tax=Escherichia coli TaxID=562 RepID=UPI001D679323|nr:ead/Ea22-like family protein [Escherichia coli]HCR7493504.1 ead/Ea22-like family protein [Shigella sonnei]